MGKQIHRYGKNSGSSRAGLGVKKRNYSGSRYIQLAGRWQGTCTYSISSRHYWCSQTASEALRLPDTQHLSAAEVNRMAVSHVGSELGVGFRLNYPSAGGNAESDLPQGFVEFLAPLHQRFAARQEELIGERQRVLSESHDGNKPTHDYPRDA